MSAVVQTVMAGVLPDIESKDLKPWDAVEEANVRKALAKAFALPKEAAKATNYSVVNVAHEFMVQAKSERAKQAILPFLEHQPSVPNVNSMAGSSPVNVWYVLDALAIVKAPTKRSKRIEADEVVALHSAQEMPLFMETVDWRFAIAPRLRER